MGVLAWHGQAPMLPPLSIYSPSEEWSLLATRAGAPRKRKGSLHCLDNREGLSLRGYNLKEVLGCRAGDMVLTSLQPQSCYVPSQCLPCILAPQLGIPLGMSNVGTANALSPCCPPPQAQSCPYSSISLPESVPSSHTRKNQKNASWKGHITRQEAFPQLKQAQRYLRHHIC